MNSVFYGVNLCIVWTHPKTSILDNPPREFDMAHNDVKSDLEIAQAAQLKHINDIAEKLALLLMISNITANTKRSCLCI